MKYRSSVLAVFLGSPAVMGCHQRAPNRPCDLCRTDSKQGLPSVSHLTRSELQNLGPSCNRQLCCVYSSFDYSQGDAQASKYTRKAAYSYDRQGPLGLAMGRDIRSRKEYYVLPDLATAKMI